MQLSEDFQPVEVKVKPAVPHEEKFIPKGAFAFFILLVALGLVIWYGIYLLMLERI